MNELHKYATFSVDLLGTPNKINSVFSMGRARIFYKGMNRNRTIIDGEVAEKLASTIPGTPIIGLFDYEAKDFTDHTPEASAFGFVPLDPHPTWIEQGDKEYLEVDVVIWDGRFEEAECILKEEKHLSMELNPTTMKGTFERIGDKTYYKMSYAEFAGITVLGDDVAPCFEDAKFISAYSSMVSAYALFIENAQENIEGGKTMEDITNVVEPEVTTEEVVEETTVVEETAEVTEPAAETVVEAETTEVTEAEAEVEEEVAEETEIVETVETPEGEFACKDDKSKCEKDEKCPECGKNPCVCEEDGADDKKDDKKDDYSALEAELADFKAKYESLENKYNEALNSLNQYTRKEKLEIISKFSTKLESEELIEKLTNEVDEHSIEEIKNELGKALVEEQLSTSDEETKTEEADANFSLNINIADNNIGNGAWDLVARHKANK